MTVYRVPSTVYQVLLKRGEFIDAGRDNRAVPYKIYYPENHGLKKMPVIIWSHGFGGNRDGAGFISRFVAGHGYTIIHLTHPGSDTSIWEGQKGHPWDILRRTPLTREMTELRFGDVPFAVNELIKWAQENPDIGAAMDFDALGMCGHSFGAMTTQAMAGEQFPDAHEYLKSYRDERFKCGILYSPVPIRKLTAETPEPHIYGPIAIPLFHMTGTDDASPLEGFDYLRRLTVYEYSGRADKYLLILKDGDHMVYNGTRGKLEENPLRGKHEDIIKVASLAYWDAYLKGDATAKEWLTGGGFGDYLNAAGEFKFALA